MSCVDKHTRKNVSSLSLQTNMLCTSCADSFLLAIVDDTYRKTKTFCPNIGTFANIIFVSGGHTKMEKLPENLSEGSPFRNQLP